MGLSLSSNAASMVTDVYSSSTSTTTITNTNANNNSQDLVLDGCDISAVSGDVNIAQSVVQAQSIQQTASVQNSQISTTAINQSLIQQAQSTVSSWGIGAAAASNNMNVAASVSTSVKNAVDISFQNLNSSAQAIICANSSISGGDSVNISQSASQSIAATQVSTSTNLQDVSTDVAQSAQQTATATVSGVDLVGVIVAAIVLVVVVGIVMAIIKAKSSGKGGGSISGSTLGSLAKLALQGGGRPTSTDIKLFVAGSVLATVLAALGGVALLQRSAHACDFTGQCAPTSSQFWFSTAGSTCSVDNRYSLGSSSTAGASLPAVAALPTLVAPPLFMCNAVQSTVPFGSAETPTLYPGALQQLVVAKVVNNSSTSSTDTSAPQRNNSGYNVGVFSELLRIAAGSAGAVAADPATAYIQALTAWFLRQLAAAAVVPPAGSAAADWCAERLLRDLLPLRPVISAPEAGSTCTNAKTGAAVTPATCPAKTSTLHVPSPSSVQVQGRGQGQGHRLAHWPAQRSRFVWRGQRAAGAGVPAKGVPAKGVPAKAVASASGPKSPVRPARLASAAACNAATGTDDCAYFVRLPGSFVASDQTTAASTSASTFVTFLCLPNAFVPNVDSGGADAGTFLGNHTESARFPDARSCFYSTNASSTPSGVGANTTVFAGTCVQTAGVTDTTKVPAITTAPSLTTDYVCGCLTLDTGEACWADGSDKYSEHDNLCYVNSGVQTTTSSASSSTSSSTKYSRRGGFLLRKADTFTPSPYSTTATDSDLFKYAATPSSAALQAWIDANPGTGQQARLFMFLRILYWLLLSAGVANRTLSELGLSTFVNDAGYSASAWTPNAALDSDQVTAVSMYGAQPLLVKLNGTFAFYSLQEIRETLGAADRAACLAQVNMWCYDKDSLGVGTAVAANGFNVAVNSGSLGSASAQINQSVTQRGLMVGRYGYCNLWFTNDAFVGATLGIACGIFALLVAYGVGTRVLRR